MSADPKPYELAAITEYGERTPAIYLPDGCENPKHRGAHWHYFAKTSRGNTWTRRAAVGRSPLVVLDLADGYLGGWPVLIGALKQAKEATGLTLVFGSLIEQIEAQCGPSKPEEPTVGALVEDGGVEWARLNTPKTPWHSLDGKGRWATWGDFSAAVRVLSPGVPDA